MDPAMKSSALALSLCLFLAISGCATQRTMMACGPFHGGYLCIEVSAEELDELESSLKIIVIKYYIF